MTSAASSPWATGTWFNPPRSAVEKDGSLVVTAVRGSDFWQQTSYGFRRDSGHALLASFAPERSVEVTFLLDYGSLFDQAGVLVRVDERTWVKAGVEVSDGAPQLAAVVTLRGASDWSMAPVPEWAGREVTLRASWSGDALTVRARAAGEAWRMIRLAPLPIGSHVTAGPYCCAPERDGLTVRFSDWQFGDWQFGAADAALYQDT